MSARFECQGYHPDSRTIVETPDLQKVIVELETDGQVVVVVPGFDRGTGPALTAEGWLQLAGHARRLVEDANAAWTTMEALDP